MNKDPIETGDPVDLSFEETPNKPRNSHLNRLPSNSTNSRRNSNDTVSFNELTPFLIPVKQKQNPTTEPVENKFDEYWTIVLNAEIPDKAAANKFLKNKTLKNLKLMNYSRLCITNYFFQLIMTIIIFYTLIIINFKFLVFNKNADVAFDLFTLFSMFAFIFELILNLLGDIEYFNSFYFYIDITSVFLLLFDLSWIRESVFNSVKDPYKKVGFSVLACFTTFSLIRVLKVIKYIFQKQYMSKRDYFLRKLKLNKKVVDIMLASPKQLNEAVSYNTYRSGFSVKGYKSSDKIKRSSSKITRNKRLSKVLNESRTGHTDNISSREDNKMYFVMNNKQLKESRLSRRLLYLTNKRLMMLTVIMLISIPFFDASFWLNDTNAFETELNYYVRLHSVDSALADNYYTNTMLPNFEKFYNDIVEISLKGFTFPDLGSYSHLRNEELRKSVKEVVYSATSLNTFGTIVISKRSYVQMQAFLNILRAILIYCLFYFGIYYFKKEARRQILNPLENMLSKINAVSRDPIKALQLAKSSRNSFNNKDINLIEDTIQKIAYLLVLGFGNAGNDLLANALKSSDFEMDYISRAQTMYGIFGFCDIRSFTDATEVLQGDIMLFVNTIGKVVHEEVFKSEGGANKNIGDAFLVVWKLRGSSVSDIEEFTQFSLTQAQKTEIHNRYVAFQINNNSGNFEFLNAEHEAILRERYFNNLKNSLLAELSLISFLKIIARIQIDSNVIKYNRNKKLKKAIPGFSVNLGYGLHAGWAIEGAIGSTFKIDVTYISPHVNMSARLEGLTKAYKVPFLFTNSLYNLFTTESVKKLCRKLDRVIVKNTEDPFELYTVDLNLQKLQNISDYSQKQAKPKANAFLSFKNIRMDHLSKKFVRQEMAKENQTLASELFKGPIETDYIEYDQIERMYEKIVMDSNLVAMLDIQASDSVKLNKELFINKYHSALELYLDGEWEEARNQFNKLNSQYPNDKTIHLILSYMKDFKYKCPSDWQNARPIND